jgi:hypothetical protein
MEKIPTVSVQLIYCQNGFAADGKDVECIVGSHTGFLEVIL